MSKALSTWLSNQDIRQRMSKALGKSFDSDFFIEQLLIALNAPNLEECTDESKFKAAHTCAALGMLPTLQHVALIPRKMSGQGTICTVMPQYQGLLALMLRHPDVQDIKHSLVHPSDDFEYDGTTQTVTRHEYDPFDDKRQFRDMADVRGGYLKISYRDGRPDTFHVVKASTIQKARACAQADNIWKQWFEEQCIKTLYRNGFARRVVPIDPMLNQLQLQAALEQEDMVLENVPTRVESHPVSNDRPPSRAALALERMLPPSPSPIPEDVPEIPERPAVTVHTFESVKKRLLKAKSHEELTAACTDADSIMAGLTESQQNQLSQLSSDAMSVLDAS